jgi:hypothetical protein
LFTTLGVILELFVVEKQLLARSEDEFFAAINALQVSIRKFHGRLPRSQGNESNRP